ncbi:TPR repeat-containing protein [Cryptosporidium ryanae]|uniref:TPR repeat-containing protein n=1 Tax=Cryptosporidium ryanae TaxID=515981 RepID=UPI00351A41FF|nr:TPR repeat-containing protein [Cryptosporidium ryanae]
MEGSKIMESSDNELSNVFHEEIPEESFPSEKEKGNEAYYNKEFENAIEHWLRAYRSCKYILSKKVYAQAPEKECKIKTLKMQLDTNLSIAYLKLKEYSNSIYYSDQALAYNPKNIKALHHKSEALFEICEYKACIDCVNSALEIEPNNSIFKKIKYNALLKQRKYIYKTKKMGEILFNNKREENTEKGEQNLICFLLNSIVKIPSAIIKYKFRERISKIISTICPLRFISRFKNKIK